MWGSYLSVSGRVHKTPRSSMIQIFWNKQVRLKFFFLGLPDLESLIFPMLD